MGGIEDYTKINHIQKDNCVFIHLSVQEFFFVKWCVYVCVHVKCKTEDSVGERKK